MTSSPNISELLVKAIVSAILKHQNLHAQWIDASCSVGSRLTIPTLKISIQDLGKMDILLRSIEKEQLYRDPAAHAVVSGLITSMQSLLSEAWVSAAYEIIRLLKSRNIWKNDPEFHRLVHDLSLVRITIDKHEIARDNKLQAPIQFTGSSDDPTATVTPYDKDDPLRSHMLPRCISTKTGSFAWKPIEIKNHGPQHKTIERQDLSDQFLSIFSN